MCVCVCLSVRRNLKNARFRNKIEGTNRHESMNRSYLQNRRVEFCKTLYLLRYGTSEHPQALSFKATPFNHGQSVIFNFPRGWISSELRSIFFDPFATLSNT